MRLFASYLIVDWSAAARPVTGANSIWIGGAALLNPPTRSAALRALPEILSKVPKPVLCGFDFPLGFPRGAGRERLWAAIRRLLDDSEDNRNNRFDVAVDLNRLLPSPMFWGRPWQWRDHALPPQRPPRMCLPEKRLTDRGSPQPVWKLSGIGSAGGQAITGIPRVMDLRERVGAKVWPFDTGLRAPKGEPVIVAEVYPSLAGKVAGTIKDREQVMALARRFADQDARGELTALFAPRVSAEDRAAIEGDEGWILGVPGNFAG
ncbi:MAG TPA: cobalamin biosynthesis protein CbiG [Solibacterales bacterium]|nr:cobalamin biosynthesis protein CbiG [Bryobacterales bacterium]